MYCKGQLFGHEDAIQGRFHSTSVKSLSTDAKLYQIRADEFTSKLNKDERSWSFIHELSKSMDKKVVKQLRRVVYVNDSAFISKIQRNLETFQDSKETPMIEQSSFSAMDTHSRSKSPKQKETIEMITKNRKFPIIIKNHNLKLTRDRLDDWRSTMRIIVNCKNGVYP